MKIKALILVSLLFNQLLYGQNEMPSNSSGWIIQFGAENISLKDRTFSPIVFSGIAPNIKLGFNQNKNNKTLWGTTITINYANIDYDNQYFYSTYIALQFNFEYLKRIKAIDKSLFFLGGQYTSELNLLDFEGFSSGSWYTAQNLQAVLRYHYVLSEKHLFTGQCSHPIIGLVARPNYAGIDEFVVANSDNIPKILYSRMQLYSIDKLINPHLIVGYTYTLPKMEWSILGSYNQLVVRSVRSYFKHQWGVNLQAKIKIGKKNEK